MAGSSVDLQEVWNNRIPAFVVLLSFTMQVTLLVTADFRRRLDKPWLRVLVWSAYMLADWAAIYALGHLSVANGPGQGKHHLMLLWAPFLLVHLGGQDNITAYALEDNRLWLRHLQALAVQAAAAAYVLYPSWSSSSMGGGGAVLRFRQASVVLYVVGILKYGERVASLWLASRNRLGNNYMSLKHLPEGWEVNHNTIDKVLRELTTHLRGEAQVEKKLLLLAHLLLRVSKKLILGPLPYDFKLTVTQPIEGLEAVKADDKLYLYKVAERQLSLMHDVLYTKAPVIKDSLYGFCIRIVSGAGTAAAFVLFHQGLMQVLMRPGYYCGRRPCSRTDVGVTYVLLVGAVVLEALATVATVCSIWTELASGPVRHYWSGTMGQLNLLDLCVRSRSSCWSKGAKLLQQEEWWNTMVYSGSTPVTEPVVDLVMDLAADLNDGLLSTAAAACPAEPFHHLVTEEEAYQERRHAAAAAAAARFFESSVRRRALLEDLGLMDGDVQKLSLVGSCDMDETILVWHIATDIYLRAIDPDQQKKLRLRPLAEADQAHAMDPDQQKKLRPLAEAVQALSNYMLFLLAARTSMLPSSANRNRYVEMCYFLTGVVECVSPQHLADMLPQHRLADLLRDQEALAQLLRQHKELKKAISENDTLQNGCWLGAKLLHQHHAHADGGDRILKMVAQVWAEILCYAGHRCSGNSHAASLSNGGELVTVAAIVMEFVKTYVYKGLYQDPTS